MQVVSGEIGRPDWALDADSRTIASAAHAHAYFSRSPTKDGKGFSPSMSALSLRSGLIVRSSRTPSP
jgi:hypothetical protein